MIQSLNNIFLGATLSNEIHCWISVLLVLLNNRLLLLRDIDDFQYLISKEKDVEALYFVLTRFLQGLLIGIQFHVLSELRDLDYMT